MQEPQPNLSEIEQQESFALEKADFFETYGSDFDNLPEFLVQNTICIPEEEMDVELGRTLLLNFIFGLHKAYELLEKSGVEPVYNITWFRDTKGQSQWILDLLGDSDATEAEDIEDENFEEVSEHDADSAEFSAYAVKKEIAKKYFPKYYQNLKSHFHKISEHRKRNRRTENTGTVSTPKQYETDCESSSIGYDRKKKSFTINLNWFAAILKRPYTPTTEGLNFSNLPDLMFFAGVEEAAHRVYFETRSKDSAT